MLAGRLTAGLVLEAESDDPGGPKTGGGGGVGVYHHTHRSREVRRWYVTRPWCYHGGMPDIAYPILIAFVALLVFAFSANGKVTQVAFAMFCIGAAISTWLFFSHGYFRLGR